MNILPRARQIAVVSCLLKGLGIRETERTAGVNRNTVATYARRLRAGELADLVEAAGAPPLAPVAVGTVGTAGALDRCRILAELLGTGQGPRSPVEARLLASFTDGCRVLHDRRVRDVRAKRLVLVTVGAVALVAEPSDRLVLAWQVGDGGEASRPAHPDRRRLRARPRWAARGRRRRCWRRGGCCARQAPGATPQGRRQPRRRHGLRRACRPREGDLPVDRGGAGA